LLSPANLLFLRARQASPYGSGCPNTALHPSWMLAEHLAISLAAYQAIASTIPGGASN
jgi:hypothetical protein